MPLPLPPQCSRWRAAAPLQSILHATGLTPKFLVPLQVDLAWNGGERSDAIRESRSARNWNIVAFVMGLVIIVVTAVSLGVYYYNLS